MNIYIFEFKMYARSLWLWALALFALQIIFMAFYPAMAKDAAMIDLILEHYPKELLQAFGMGESVSLATVLGYYTFVFAFVQLCLAVQGAYYGFHFLSLEERELTADFLFSKPVTRTKILVSKYVAALTALVITHGAVIGSTFVAIALFRDGKSYELDKLLVLLASVPVFQLFFFSIGMLVTVLTTKIRNVLSYAMALAFGLHILNALRGIVGGRLLGIASPFYHFEPANIIETGGWAADRVWISVLVILCSTLISYKLYLKRNIHAL